MKMTKRILAIVMVVAMLAVLLVGCSNKPNNNNTANNTNSSAADSAVSSATSSAASSAASSQKEGEETFSGTGDNSKAVLSMTLFDKEYTLGKSRVKDLSDNDWGYDPEDWKDIDMEKKIEYKQTGGSYLTMDNSTTEIEISFKNLAETFAVPEQCILTRLQFKGSPDGAITKAGVKIFGGKIDLTKCTSFDELDSQLKSTLSSYVREKQTDSEYTLSYTYKAETKDGKFYMYASFDKKENKMKNIDTSFDLNYDYTYQAE